MRSSSTKPAKLSRWRKIITEASEQSGRGRVPALLAPVPLPEAIARSTGHSNLLVAWEEGEEHDVRSAVQSLARQPDSESLRLGLVIGPEGGLTVNEVDLCRAAGGEVISLGRRILRAETAAIVGSALVIHESERLVRA